MKTKSRIVYISILAAVIFLALCPICLFFYSFNAKEVKQELIGQFGNGYNVTINGTVRPKLWHGLSFEADDLQVTTQSGVPLVRIDTISGTVSWIHLLVGDYKIKRLSLNGVALNENNIINNNAYNLFAFSKQANSVFDSLRYVEISEIHSSDANAPHPFVHGILHIKQHLGMANITIGVQLQAQQQSDTQKQNGQMLAFILMQAKVIDNSNNVIKFSDFTAKIYNKQFTAAINADASYQINKQKLILQSVNGDITIGQYLGQISANVAKLSLHSMIVENLIVDLHNENENVGDLFKQDLSIELNHLGFLEYKHLDIDTVRTKYRFNFAQNQIELNSTMQQIQVTPNSESLVSRQCYNAIDVYSPKLSNQHLSADLSGVCGYNFNQHMTWLNLNGMFNQAPVKLMLKIFSHGGHDGRPLIDVAGNIDNLDLSAASVQHASNQPPPSYTDNSPLPFAWVSMFNMLGDLKIKTFVLDRIRLNDVMTHFVLNNNVLDVKALQARVYGGNLNGRAVITKTDDGYNIATNEEIYGLNLQSLFSDLFAVEAISGNANLRVNTVMNAVQSYKDLQQKLNGNVTVDANHGAFQGVDFNLFASPQLVGQNMSSMEHSTMFEQLQAHFVFANGVSNASRVVFYSPYVIASGTGMVDLVNDKIDYALTIKSALPRNKQKINLVVIPVSATGDLFAPTISIQNVQLSSKMVHSTESHHVKELILREIKAIKHAHEHHQQEK